MSGVIFYCTICDWRGEIPDDAFEVTTGKTSTWKFAGGLHHLRKIKVRRVKTIAATAKAEEEQQ